MTRLSLVVESCTWSALSVSHWLDRFLWLHYAAQCGAHVHLCICWLPKLVRTISACDCMPSCECHLLTKQTVMLCHHCLLPPCVAHQIARLIDQCHFGKVSINIEIDIWLRCLLCTSGLISWFVRFEICICFVRISIAIGVWFAQWSMLSNFGVYMR